MDYAVHGVTEVDALTFTSTLSLSSVLQEHSWAFGLTPPSGMFFPGEPGGRCLTSFLPNVTFPALRPSLTALLKAASWWSELKDSMLPLQGMRVPSLVRQPRSDKPQAQPKKKQQPPPTLLYLLHWLF